jgi:DNA-binding MarR family transcriptional regulator
MPRSTGAARQEAKRNGPGHAVGQDAVLALLRTASVLQRFYARIIEPHGLTYQQYNVLRILRDAGARGLPTLAIRDRMIEQAPGITRLIDKLEGQGLVRRQRGAPDRRQVFCRIVPAGLALLKRLDAAIDQADDTALGMLSATEQRALVRLLDRVQAEHRDEGADGELDEPSTPRAKRKGSATRGGHR